MSGHSGRVTSVAFSPDGTRIASGSQDKLVMIWDAETGAEVSCVRSVSGVEGSWGLIQAVFSRMLCAGSGLRYGCCGMQAGAKSPSIHHKAVTRPIKTP